jgi:hypothetical protein
VEIILLIIRILNNLLLNKTWKNSTFTIQNQTVILILNPYKARTISYTTSFLARTKTARRLRKQKIMGDPTFPKKWAISTSKVPLKTVDCMER